MSQLSQTSLLNFVQDQFGTTRTEKFLGKLEKVVPWNTIAARIKSSSVRARVEHPFATLKTKYGNYWVRYL